MQYRKLGTNGPDVSVVAMGCWTIAGGRMWGDVNTREAVAAIHTAVDSGITLFDTAEAYGDGASEELLGRALREKSGGTRKKVLIASKVGTANLRKDDVIKACEGSLKRLQTDYIDIYQQHWPDHRPGEPGVPEEETMDALTRLREQGKILHIGVCNFGVPNMREIPDGVPVVSNQLPYSALWRAIELEIVPESSRRGMGILTYSSLMHGLLTGRYHTADEVPVGRARSRHFAGSRAEARHGEPGREKETFAAIDEIRETAASMGVPMGDLALAWVIAQEGITSVLAGARTPAQISENARAADLVLDAPTLARLDRATSGLKEAFGKNPDMWDSVGRTAY